MLETGSHNTEQSTTTPPLTQWQRWAWGTLEYRWPFGLSGHTADSHSTSCQQRTPQNAFHRVVLSPQSVQISRLAPSQMKDPALFLFSFVGLVIAQLSNLSKSLCKISLILWESTPPPSLVSLANFFSILVSKVLYPKSLIKILKKLLTFEYTKT